MTCLDCLRRLLLHETSSLRSATRISSRASPSHARRISLTASQSQDPQPLSPNVAQFPREQRNPPSATSTSAAQPFSTPRMPSPKTTGTTAHPRSAQPKAPRILSSVPGGTPLKGLNYFKNKEDPVAMDDHEYPEWLWSVLDERKTDGAGQKQEIDPRLFGEKPRPRVYFFHFLLPRASPKLTPP